MYAKEQRIHLVLEKASLSLVIFMRGSESRVEFHRHLFVCQQANLTSTEVGSGKVRQ